MSLSLFGLSSIIKGLLELLDTLRRPTPPPTVQVNIELNFDQEFEPMTIDQDLNELSDIDANAMKALLLDLLAMDKNCRAHGHTLVEVLAKSAKDSFGIDIRPGVQVLPPTV